MLGLKLNHVSKRGYWCAMLSWTWYSPGDNRILDAMPLLRKTQVLMSASDNETEQNPHACLSHKDSQSTSHNAGTTKGDKSLCCNCCCWREQGNTKSMFYNTPSHLRTLRQNFLKLATNYSDFAGTPLCILSAFASIAVVHDHPVLSQEVKRWSASTGKQLPTSTSMLTHGKIYPVIHGVILGKVSRIVSHVSWVSGSMFRIATGWLGIYQRRFSSSKRNQKILRTDRYNFGDCRATTSCDIG